MHQMVDVSEALEEKGMALGKRGMARRHAKRGWGKHYFLNITASS